MGLTRIELSGRLVKPPLLGVTPRGRAVLRLSLDCGEEREPLLLEVVVTDETARDLARALTIGQRVRATGSLKAVRRGTPAGSGNQQLEVVASEVYPERFSGTSGAEVDSTASRALFPAKA
jgi:single-stranded DNA-binding protein